MKTDVRRTMEALLVADVEAADRPELERAVRALGTVRSWLDAFEVRCARRSKALAAEGRARAPESTLTDHGRRSGRDAAAATEREAVCASMASFEDALAAGDVSSGHVDALARATKRLDDDGRDELAALEEELLAAASSERVETFDRRVRDTIARILAQQTRNDAEELDRQRARSRIKRWTDKATGMRHTHMELDPLRDAALWSTIDRQVQRVRQVDGNASTPWAQLQIDTLIETAIAGAGGTGTCPCAHGRDASEIDPWYRVPEATLLVDLSTLTDGLHANSICELEDGVPIPVSTMRRLLCDAEVLPVVLSGTGEALDAGRSRRTVTRPQRRALRAMHRACAHPDCTVPFSACRIHHVRWWWRDRGPTDIDNLIPLCERHHHLVHEGGWQLTMTSGRIATWTQPDGSVAHAGSCIHRAPAGVARNRPARITPTSSHHCCGEPEPPKVEVPAAHTAAPHRDPRPRGTTAGKADEAGDPVLQLG